jgi:hypothetical protein
MNGNDDLPRDSASRDDAPLDASLRLQLRGLRRELAPERDLWPGIAARIATTPATTRRSAPRRFAPLALAASLLLALGVAWPLRPPAPLAPQLASQQAPARLIDREAEAMTREYRAALHELQASTPDTATPRPEQPALRELDRSARQIRTALARDPDARFLLERLRHTYSLRLELTQRAALT